VTPSASRASSGKRRCSPPSTTRVSPPFTASKKRTCRSLPPAVGVAWRSCARVYRPRRARESPLFRLVEQHLEEFPMGVPGALRQAARPAPSRRRARAARVPHVWPGRARLRTPLVRHVSDQRALPVFLPRPGLLSVMRKEEAARVGGVVTEGRARASPASSRRPVDGAGREIGASPA
jgi:hypothetical protein